MYIVLRFSSYSRPYVLFSEIVARESENMSLKIARENMVVRVGVCGSRHSELYID